MDSRSIFNPAGITRPLIPIPEFTANTPPPDIEDLLNSETPDKITFESLKAHPLLFDNLLLKASEKNSKDFCSTLIFNRLKSLDSKLTTPNKTPLHDILLILKMMRAKGFTTEIPIYYQILNNMIKNGINEIDTPGSERLTPLGLACLYGDLNAVGLFLSVGSNLNLPQQNSSNIWEFVQKLNNLSLKRIIDVFTPEKAKPPTIQIKEYANLVGDAFIEDMTYGTHDTKLEGSTLDITLTLTETLLNSYKKEKKLDKKLYDKIDSTQKLIQDSLPLTNLLFSCTTDPAIKPVCAQMFQAKLSQLTVGQKCLIPFGWIDHKSGHAMLCEFEKDAAGKFNMKIINTGSGTEWHFFTPTGTKRKILPYESYEGIELSEINDTNFFQALIELKTQIPEPGMQYKPEDIYFGVLRRFESHKVDSNNADLSAFITGQRSGTCAMRCIMAYLRNTLDKKDYKVLKNYMQTQTSFAFLDSHRDDLKVDPNLRELVLRTSENLARQVNKLKDLGIVLDREIQEAPLEISRRVRELDPRIDPVAKFSIPPDLSAQIAAGTVNIKQSVGSLIKLAQASSFQITTPLKGSENTLDMPIHPPEIYSDPKLLLGHLQNLIKYNITEKSSATSTDSAVQMLIRQVLLLPMPQVRTSTQMDVWAIDPKQVTLEAIQQILNHLSTATTTPNFHMYDRIVAINKLYAIAWKLVCGLDDPKLPLQLQMKHYRISTAHLHVILNNIDNLSFDPQIETQLKEVIHFFENDNPNMSNTVLLFHFHVWHNDKYLLSTKDYWEKNKEGNGLRLPIEPNTGEYTFVSEAIIFNNPDQDPKYVEERKQALEKEFGYQITSTSYDQAMIWFNPKRILPETNFEIIRNLALTCVGSTHESEIDRTKRSKSNPPGAFEGYRAANLVIGKENNREGNCHLYFDICAGTLNEKIDPWCIKRKSFEGRMAAPSMGADDTYYRYVLDKGSENFVIVNDSTRLSLSGVEKFNPMEYVAHQSILFQNNLIIPRLIQHYKKNINDLLRPSELVFLSLILFSKGHLSDLLLKNKEFTSEVLNLINQALTEFHLFLSQKSEKQTNLEAEAITNLYFIKGQLLQYFEFHQSMNIEAILEERRKLINDIDASLSEKAHPHFKKEQTNLRLNKILLTALSQLPFDESNILKIFYQLAQNYLDPSPDANPFFLKNLAQSAYQSQQENLEKYFQNHSPDQGCRAVLKAYYIQNNATSWKGKYPIYHSEIDNKCFQVNLLSGQVKCDGVEFGKPQLLYMSKEFKTFFGENVYPVATATKIDKNTVRYEVVHESNHFQFTLKETDSDPVVSVQKYLDGEWYTYLDKNQIKQIPIPLVDVPNGENYKVWIQNENGKIIIENNQMQVKYKVNQDSTIIFENDSKSWNFIDLNSVTFPSPLTQLKHLDHPDFIGSYEKKNDEVSDIKIQFTRYRDKNGTPIEFEKRLIKIRNKHGIKKEVYKIVWTSNPQYFISKDQQITGMFPFKNYLVLEDAKGSRKVLMTSKSISEIDTSWAFNLPDKSKSSVEVAPKYPLQLSNSNQSNKGISKLKIIKTPVDACTIECELLSLDKNNHPNPIGTNQCLLMAYHCMGTKNYLTAMECLSRCRGSSPLSDSELKWLARIFHQRSETDDQTPEAQALRLYAAYIVYENFSQFPQDSHKDVMRQELEIKSFHDDPPVLFRDYWKGTRKVQKDDQLIHDHLKNLYAEYLKVAENVPKDLRVLSSLEESTQSGFLSLYNESVWLEDLSQTSLLPSLEDRLKALRSSALGRPRKELPDDTFKGKKNSSISLVKFSVTQTYLEPFNNLLKDISRLRPSKSFRVKFPSLLWYATNGTKKEKSTILNFIRDGMMESKDTSENLNLKLILEILCIDNPSYTAKLNSAIEHYKLDTVLKTDTKEIDNIIIEYVKSLSHSSPQHWALVNRESAKLIPKIQNATKVPLPINLNTANVSQLKQIFNENYQLQNNSKKVRKYQMAPIPEQFQKGSYTKKKEQSLQDWMKGCELNDQQQIYKMNSSDSLHRIHEDLSNDIPKLRALVDQNLISILEKARTLPQESEGKIRAQLRIEGKQYVPPNLQECIGLFVKNDETLYQKRLPNLSIEQIKELHQTVGNYLIASTSLQQYERCFTLTKKAQKQISRNKEQSKIDKTLGLLSSELKKERTYDPNKWPSFLVFEHYGNLLLREEQSKAIENMLRKQPDGKFPHQLLQMIMAAGKTYVLGTILAIEKADGYHLSMLVPPTSLLETNAQDMKSRCQAFFGVNAKVITYSRSPSQFTVEYLQNLKNLLITTINNREFIILAPETIQSMENKYLEARAEINELRKELKQLDVENSQREINILKDRIGKLEIPTQELKSILKLMRERGAATFDEADLIFTPRKETNYPTKHKKPVDRGSCDLLGELFYIAATDEKIKHLGLDLYRNNQSSLLEEQHKTIKDILSVKILDKIASDKQLISLLGMKPETYVQHRASLEEYFKDFDKPSPLWLKDLEKLYADRIVLLRQDIHVWMGESWKKTADEHYGRSNDANIQTAKPNIAANTPNERSEFANEWEKINKTLHIYIYKGLDAEQVKKFIDQSKAKARSEFKESGEKLSLEQLPSVMAFRQVFKDNEGKNLELFKLDSNSPDEIKQIQACLNNGKPETLRYVFEFLKSNLYPTLETHTHQINNTGQNLGSAVNSIQGYSGSVDNPYIFNEVFDRDPNLILLDKGTNGKIIDVLCQKNGLMHEVGDFKSIKDMLHHLLDHRPSAEINRCHALIDVGAYFKSQSNHTIAVSALSYFTERPDSTVKGILFYKDNNLTFIENGKENHPITLPGTDPETIRSFTGLKPHQLFTIFDQSHSTGADILQSPTALALTTIGSNTSVRDLLQGVMRMRQLFQEQQIEFIVPKEILKLIESRIGPFPNGLKIEQMINFCETNTFEAEEKDNLKACFQKLNDCPRRFILDGLYEKDSPEDEQALYEVTENLFVRNTALEIYDNFADKPELKSNIEVLNGQKRTLAQILQKAKVYLDASKVEEQIKQLDRIVEIGAQKTPIKLPSKASSTDGSTVENEEFEEKHVLQEKEMQVEAQKFTSEYEVVYSREVPWAIKDLEYILQPSANFKEAYPSLATLNSLMLKTTSLALFEHIFSRRLVVSSNFASTVESELNLLDHYHKKPYEVLVFRDPRTKLLNVALISSKESSQVKDWLRDGECKLYEMSLMQPEGPIVERGTLILDEATQNEVRTLLFQVCLFSGNIKELLSPLKREMVIEWTKTEPALKRKLLENVLLEGIQYEEYRGSLIERLLIAEDDREPNFALWKEILIVGSSKESFNLNELDQLLKSHPPETMELLEFYAKIGTNLLHHRKEKNAKKGSFLIDYILNKYPISTLESLQFYKKVMIDLIFTNRESGLTKATEISELMEIKFPRTDPAFMEFYLNFAFEMIRLNKNMKAGMSRALNTLFRLNLEFHRTDAHLLQSSFEASKRMIMEIDSSKLLVDIVDSLSFLLAKDEFFDEIMTLLINKLKFSNIVENVANNTGYTIPEAIDFLAIDSEPSKQFRSVLNSSIGPASKYVGEAVIEMLRKESNDYSKWIKLYFNELKNTFTFSNHSFEKVILPLVSIYSKSEVFPGGQEFKNELFNLVESTFPESLEIKEKFVLDRESIAFLEDLAALFKLFEKTDAKRMDKIFHPFLKKILGDAKDDTDKLAICTEIAKLSIGSWYEYLQLEKMDL